MINEEKMIYNEAKKVRDEENGKTEEIKKVKEDKRQKRDNMVMSEL